MTATNNTPDVSEETQNALFKLMEDFNTGKISAKAFEEQASILAEQCGYKLTVNSNTQETVGKMFNFAETIAVKDDDYAVERTIELADKTQYIISDDSSSEKTFS